MARCVNYSVALVLLIGMFSCMTLNNEPAQLRVMSYNIHHAEGMDGLVDGERIAAIIEAIQPDIVCLQEVDQGVSRSNNVDYPESFALRLGMAVAYGSNLRFQGGDYGNAILSNYPITKQENVKLPTVSGTEPRGALQTTIKWKGKPITVIGTHWSLSEEARAQQGAYIAENLGSGPVIVAGDLNESQEGRGVERLLERLQDTVAGLGEGESPFTISTESPHAQIDHILVSEHFQVKRMWVVRDETAKVASDHFPVVVDLAWVD